MRRGVFWIFVAGLMFGIVSSVDAAENNSVSLEEFNKLKADYDQLKQEVQELKKTISQQNQSAPPSAAQPVAASQGASVEYVTADEFKKLKDQVKETRPGLSNFIVSGYGFTDYKESEGSPSTFSAGVNPVFLWKASDKLLFETELELSLEDGDTSTNLEFADAQYLLNDYVTGVAGKFITPFGTFLDRHPKWINKLPDKPYGYPDGSAMLVPESQIGAQIRGGIPLLRDSKVKYAMYVSNGPTVKTTATNAGELSFSNTNDNNHNKAFGGQVGFVPIPPLEVGYSWETSRVGANNTNFYRLDALVQGVDLSYVRDLDPIKGTVNFKAEQIWSHVDSVDYGTSGGAFQNDRWARYIQLSYRPDQVDLPFIKNLEPVFRFDQIHHPSAAPTFVNHDRYTWGLDYWISPNVVTKAAYEKDLQSKGGANNHTFLLEAAVGF